jgi:hypothetical protein
MPPQLRKSRKIMAKITRSRREPTEIAIIPAVYTPPYVHSPPVSVSAESAKTLFFPDA